MIRPVQKDLYAVIGNPVAHSLSPVMMNAVFEALRIPAVYLALQVDDLEEDLVTLAKLGMRGLSVTIPHKESAYRLAEVSDEPAQVMGAVNTLRLHGSRWEGLNTDWIGALSALRHAMNLPATHRNGETPPPEDENPCRKTFTHHSSFITHHSLQGQRALLIGAGGVARAVGYGLKREGAAITITNRGVERGEALARAFVCDFIPLSELRRQETAVAFDIIVQGTSVGLLDEEQFTLIPDCLFHPGTVVHGYRLPALVDAFPAQGQSGGMYCRPRRGNAAPPGGRPTGVVVWWTDPAGGGASAHENSVDGGSCR